MEAGQIPLRQICHYPSFVLITFAAPFQSCRKHAWWVLAEGVLTITVPIVGELISKLVDFIRVFET